MYHVPNPAPGTVPGSVFQTPDGKPGLAVQYFECVHFDKPAGKVIELKVDHRWPDPMAPNQLPPAGCLMRPKG